MTDRAFEDNGALMPVPAMPASMGGAQPEQHDPFPEDQHEPFPETPPKRPLTGAIAPGPVGDWIFGDTKHSSLARIMHAFGASVYEDASKWGMSDETKDHLRKKGVFNDYVAGQHSLLKANAETLLRSGAVAVNTAMYGIPALFHGAQEAVVEAGEQTKGTALEKGMEAVGLGKPSQLAREIASVPQAIPDFNFRPYVPSAKTYGKGLMAERTAVETAKVASARASKAEGGPISVRFLSREEAARNRRILEGFVPPPLAEARDLGVIGPEGEAGWKGLVPVEHDVPGMPPIPEAAQAAAPDLHAAARAIEPKLFEEYDALTKRRDILRRAFESGESIPANAAINLKETEARLVEMSASVKDAYRKAEEANGGPAEQPTQPANASEVAGTAPAEAAPPAGEAAPAREAEPGAAQVASERAAEGVASKSIEDQRATIAHDVGAQLVRAGRPPEEAAAAAQLTAARYIARAERMKGALGTPEELYRREGAEIRAMEIRRKVARAANPATMARALDDFQQRMAAGKEAAAARRNEGASAPKFVSAAEQYRSMSKEDRADLEKAWHEAQTEAGVEQADGSLLTKDDLAFMASGEFFQRRPAPPGPNLFTEREGEGQTNLPGTERISESDLAKRRAAEPMKPGVAQKPMDIGLFSDEAKQRELFQANGPRIVSTKDMQEAVLRNEWTQHGPDLDYNDVPNATWVKEVRAWNKTRDFTKQINPEDYKFGSQPEFEKAFEEKYLTGNKRKFPGAKKANEWFEEQGEPERGAYLAGEEPSELFQHALGSFLPRGEGKPGLLKLAKDANASTFLHESGHDFLEQMMRDAAHEAAPEDVKADAKTVRDWLGIESHEDLNTGWPGERGKKARAAHEKFARGFETYLMEGVAPSKALARVFAQFKAWLTSIYKTVLALKSPINDDIRAVFDRMLATEPERTVIAPERETIPGFAEEHAARAEATPHERAHPVAEDIQAERDSAAASNLVDEENARLKDVADETRRREAGAPQPDRDGNAPRPVGGESGPDPQAGAVLPGGNQAAGEGAGTSAGAGEVPAGANLRFRNPGTPLIDKAGNIRLDKLNQPEDVDAVIRTAARNNNDFLEERRGVLSDGQTIELADALGMDPAWLDRKKIGEAFNVEEIRAARRLLVQSATTVRDAMIAAKDGDIDATVKLAEAIARHEMIQGKVSQATAEAGRALRAFREEIPGSDVAATLNDWLKANTGRTLFQLQDMARFGSNLTSPRQISQLVHDTANGKIKQAVLYYYVNSLISGPVTHTRYFVGNVLTALWAPTKTLVAAGIDTAATLARLQDERRIFFGEAGAEIYALAKGSREGWKAAGEGWRTGNTPHLPGEQPPSLFESQPVVPPIPGKIGQVIGYPGKAVGAIHGFSSAVRYEQEIAKLAYRQAMREGLSGTDFVNRVADLGNRPTPEMMDAAVKVARKDLYMAPAHYASLESKIGRFANHNIVTKLILPFTKIDTQIASSAIENTPAGLFMQKVRDNISGKNGVEARNTQMASIVASTALMGMVGEMAAEGLVTGAGPSDPQQQRAWRLTHNPYSITIGNVTIPYRGLGMLGMQMAIAANAVESTHGFPDPGNEKEHNLVASWISAFEKSVLDDTWLRGVKDMIDAVFHHEEYGDNYVANMVTNWVPFSIGLGQVTHTPTLFGFVPNPLADPYQRETRASSLSEEIKKQAQAKIPFWSQSLMPRRDQFGEPIPSSNAMQNYANDPVARMMDELHFKSAPFPRKIRGVELTDQQHDDFARIAGRTAKMLLDNFVKTPGVNEMAPAARADHMHKLITMAREQAAKTVMMNAYGSENDIQRKAVEAKKVKKGLAPAH